MSLPPQPSCVITGAGSGFGRALAIELGRRGARLILADINPVAVEEAAHEAIGAGAQSADARQCDVARADDVGALANAAAGSIDLVVNNAGVSTAGLVGALPLDDWRWTIDVNLLGVIYGCHSFVPRLRAQGHGHLLNVASAAGLLCAPRMAAYNVAKAGVIALSETLSAELAGTGVGITVICPTYFRTDIVRSGRFVDPALRALAERLVAKGPPADVVARAALASVKRGELYSLPMADGRWLWRLKRLSPRAFRTLLVWASAERARSPM